MLTHEVKRPWWAWLWRDRISVAITSAEVRCTSGNETDSIAIAAIDLVKVSRRWYGTRLTLVTRDRPDPAKWPLLNHKDARLIASRLVGAVHGPGCKAACIAFEKLLDDSGYLNHGRVQAWLNEYHDLWQRVRDVPLLTGATNTESSAIDTFRNYYSQCRELVKARNEKYAQDAASKYADFFARLESQPLTPRQIEAVLQDEDHNLVVAGAGTGKTSVVVGKVGFLIESGAARPDEILALAFARKASEEMQERILSRTGHHVEVRTFHSLGLHIVTSVEGEKSAVSSMAVHENEQLAWISKCLGHLLADQAFRDRYVSFAVYHRHTPKYLDEFRNRAEYLRYMRKHEPQTLRGEIVKSFEELLIADWLTINGIRYEYEAPYRYNTASQTKRQYKPDFYLPDYGIYLEHFGVDRNGNTKTGINAAKYGEGIRWKRELHAQHNTILIETYSYERMEGILLSQLEKKLVEAGVALNPLTDAELRRVIEQPQIQKPLVTLLKDFMNVFKANLWTMDEVRSLATASPNPARANAFLDLSEVVFQRYQQRLEERRELDFSDLIARAAEYVESGAYMSRFTRIIVDEFQDISRGRKKLLLALLRQVEDCRLFCVGDDWQSIFAFTGSDLQTMTQFEEVFGHTAHTDLDQTFRFNQELVRVSSRFIQKNPTQLRKELAAQTSIGAPAVHLLNDEPGALAVALAKIDSLRVKSERASVLLLGRYNFLEPEDLRDTVQKFPMLNVRYLTVHKAKGLEADFVVLLGVRSGRYGFPAEVASDPIMSLVVPSDNTFEYAEERRLFYVALTRARHSVFIVTDPARPSVFVEELLRREYEGDVVKPGIPAGVTSCPRCNGALVLVHANRFSGSAWKCEFAPYCGGHARMCGVCKEAPMRFVMGALRCANPKCPSHKRRPPTRPKRHRYR